MQQLIDPVKVDPANVGLLKASWSGCRVAVLIPCYNESTAIKTVIDDFRASLPHADIYVYDNNSNDGTSKIAAECGAIVRHETLQGKGNVIRRMFSDVEADIYLMVDGDDTYEAKAAPLLIDTLVNNSLDMVNAKRVDDNVKEAYRPGHRFGNWLLTTLVVSIFGERTQDMLSGYRVFSRRFVKSFPALAMGFEIETELTVHALELRMPIQDVSTTYKERPEGSESKLNTIQDGIRILTAIGLLVKEERPLEFFSFIAALLLLVSLGVAYPVVTVYLETGLVPRLPTAILATGIMILSFLSFFSGVVLSTVTHGRREMKRLMYLQIPGVGVLRDKD